MTRRRRTRTLLGGLLVTAIALTFSQSSEAQASTDFESCSQLEEVVPLPDGAAVAAGSTWNASDCRKSMPWPRRFLIRFAPDGSLDSGFGEGGVVDLPGSVGKVLGVEHSPAGRLTVKAQFEIVRYLANGTLDPGFAEGGQLDLGLSGDTSENANAIDVTEQHMYALQTAGGQSVLVRFTPDGTRDESFGDDGLLHASAGQRWWAIEADSAGRILLPGSREAGPGIRESGVFRLLPNGDPDPAFGDSDGFAGAESPGKFHLLADGTMYFLGTSTYPLVKDHCWNGTVASLGADGGPALFPSQLIGDCRIQRLSDVFPNGDLLGTHVSTYVLNSDQRSAFSISRWRPRETPDPYTWNGGGQPEYRGAIQISPAGQSTLAAAIDQQRGQIVAVGFAEVPVCLETCSLERLMAMARFDAETGAPVTSFADAGAMVFPGNSCPRGVGPGTSWPRATWNRCRVAAPKRSVTARLHKPWSKRPVLRIVASPGPPPAYLWGTRQVLRINLPKSLGPLARLKKSLAVEFGGEGSNGAHQVRFEGRKLVLRYLASQGGCGIYDCSDPDPTIEFRVRLGVQPGNALRKAIKRKSMKLFGSLAFQPDSTRYPWGSEFSSWFAPQGKAYRTRVAIG